MQPQAVARIGLGRDRIIRMLREAGAEGIGDDLVSVERAREVYHVALTQDRHGRCAVDEEETVRLRKARPHRQAPVEKQD